MSDSYPYARFDGRTPLSITAEAIEVLLDQHMVSQATHEDLALVEAILVRCLESVSKELRKREVN